MASNIVEITVRGFNDLVANVAKGKFDPAAKRRIHDAVGANLLNRQRQRFLKAVDPDGKPWPVSFAALRRTASGRDGKTLFDTGTLFNSIQFGILGPDLSEIGTNVPYATKHQLGEDGNPVRQFLGFTQEDANSAAIIAAKIIDDQLEGK